MFNKDSYIKVISKDNNIIEDENKITIYNLDHIRYKDLCINANICIIYGGFGLVAYLGENKVFEINHQEFEISKIEIKEINHYYIQMKTDSISNRNKEKTRIITAKDNIYLVFSDIKEKCKPKENNVIKIGDIVFRNDDSVQIKEDFFLSTYMVAKSFVNSILKGNTDFDYSTIENEFGYEVLEVKENMATLSFIDRDKDKETKTKIYAHIDNLRTISEVEKDIVSFNNFLTNLND